MFRLEAIRLGCFRFIRGKWEKTRRQHDRQQTKSLLEVDSFTATPGLKIPMLTTVSVPIEHILSFLSSFRLHTLTVQT